MHGASYHGHGGRALHALADHYDFRTHRRDAGTRRVRLGALCPPSCAGLTRASIILRDRVFAKQMDRRVKPGDDSLGDSGR